MSALRESLMQRAAGLRRSGRMQDAIHLYEEIARRDPWDFAAFYEIGMILMEVRQLDDAEKFLGEALRLNPRFAEGQCVRGLVLLELRRREEALACFDRALALQPNFVEALSSRATALLELNRLEEALAAFDQVLQLKPDHAISWNNRGNTFVAMGRLEEAVASFDRALALNPGLETAISNRNIALLELKRVSRIPAAAVKILFDDYSATYDAALSALGYAAPAHLRALYDRVSRTAGPPLAVLDFGCGTGLGGMAFNDLTQGGRLDGIDLSARMIEAARKRGIYTDLIIGDFESAPAAWERTYDLVIAADALIYHGDLSPALKTAAHVLKAGALCLFTVEKKEGEGWEQTPANRFCHARSYVEAVATECGFSVVDIAECALRTESHAPVSGLAVALRNRDSEEA